jgi:hypothetical protein
LIKRSKDFILNKIRDFRCVQICVNMELGVKLLLPVFRKCESVSWTVLLYIHGTPMKLLINCNRCRRPKSYIIITCIGMATLSIEYQDHLRIEATNMLISKFSIKFIDTRRLNRAASNTKVFDGIQIWNFGRQSITLFGEIYSISRSYCMTCSIFL